MTALTEQEGGWINEVATRLRLIQTDTSQLESAKRCEYLAEEVERSFNGVSTANRKRLLEALLVRFPVAGKVLGTLPAAPASAPVAPPSPATELPEETLERLLAALPKLPEEKRAGFARKFVESGLVPTGSRSGVLEISEESLRALGLPAGQPPAVERVVQLAGLLLDVVSRLDQTALKTMEVLSPRSPLLKRNESIRRGAARFLLGEVETIDPQARELTALLGALLAAALGGGRVFGQQYVERFSPTAIEDVVTAEGGGGMFGRSKKERCWDRYADLARDFATPDLVERKIKECLAAVVQRTVEKGGTGGR
jgi:hypothetical protein